MTGAEVYASEPFCKVYDADGYWLLPIVEAERLEREVTAKPGDWVEFTSLHGERCCVPADRITGFVYTTPETRAHSIAFDQAKRAAEAPPAKEGE